MGPLGIGHAQQFETELAAWVKIGPDDEVTVLISRCEMGQGVSTSLAMVLAEELEADWAKVRTEWAPVTLEYAPQSTGSSKSIRTLWKRLLIAGATAREMLLEAGALKWGVPKETCQAVRGFVIHHATGRRLGYGSLAEKASMLKIPERVHLKNPKGYELIGKALRRLGTPKKAKGELRYCYDLKMPNMMVATIARCPVLNGWAKTVDANAAKEIEGVRYVIPVFGSPRETIRRKWAYMRSNELQARGASDPVSPAQGQTGSSDFQDPWHPTRSKVVGVAVVARDFRSAQRGRDALRIEWESGPNGNVDNLVIAGIFDDWLREETGKLILNRGNVLSAEASSAKTLSAVYRAPYLAHVSSEPMCCVASVREHSAEFWVPTQDPWSSVLTASQWTGLGPTAIELHKIEMGGGFGRRLSTDFVAEAAQVSRAVGAPVKVLWTREDDIQHDHYRPAYTCEIRAGIDDKGWITFWWHRIAALGSYVQLLTGVDEIPYGVPNKAVELLQGRLPEPVKTGAHRGVGHVQNAFAIECFMDEIAAATHMDPFELRRKLLARSPRHKAVLELAASKAGWNNPLPNGRYRGIAVQAHEVGSIAAQVAEVSLENGDEVRVHRVICAVDCGRVVNPSIVESQIFGGILFGLSAALKEEITLQKGQVVQSNFHDYPILRMNEIPSIEVHLTPSYRTPVGVGELGVLPIGAAVANAVFAATGKPVRRLPIRIARPLPDTSRG